MNEFVSGYKLEVELNTLITRVKNGDEGAFDVLCEKYTALTENTVRRFAPSLGLRNGVPQSEAAADIEELRQDAVMALYKAAKSYDFEGDGQKVSFGLYAKICMNNAMITKVRKYKRTLKKLEKRDRLLRGEQSGQGGKTRGGRRRGSADSSAEDFAVMLEFADFSEPLKAAVNSLSAYERKVFDLYITGKSTKEIASELHRTEKSVDNACYRVKAKIKGLLKS